VRTLRRAPSAGTRETRTKTAAKKVTASFFSVERNYILYPQCVGIQQNSMQADKRMYLYSKT